ncbi:MAG: hypothetical protein EOO60_02540 [Hymenobacter sp.]|nr:MAG: hypothetical protein EOO60_02540 [Hymenobacter sp.]
MKKLLLAGLLLPGLPALAQASAAAVATQPAPAASVSALDTKNGFRTYLLGTPISAYPQLKRKGKDLYQSPTEPLLVADIPLTSLNFTSYKGRLASIAFGTLGTDNIEKLLAIFTSEYGPSTSANAVLQTWIGKSVTMYVTRVGAGDGEVCIVMIKSNELAAAQNAAEK